MNTVFFFTSFLSNSTVCDTLLAFSLLNTDRNQNNGEKTHEYNGDIEFKKFSLQMDNKLILKAIDLKINSGEKVLICGRSGSGKSTLVTCILRLHNPKSRKGSILIGGQNFEDYDLEYLRSSIAYMQQVILN